MAQGAVNLAGPVKVLSESYYPEMFASIYQRPAEARRIFEERGWTHGRRPAAPQPHARLARLPRLGGDRGVRRRLRPPARGQAQAGRHPGRGAGPGHRRPGEQVLPQGARRPGRLPDGDALRGAARGPPPRGLPPELRLLAPHRGPRPRRGRRLLRALRRAEDLRRDPPRRPRPPAPGHGLDVLLLRVRLDGLDEDLPARDDRRRSTRRAATRAGPASCSRGRSCAS